MVGDGEDALVAAAAHIHDEEVVAWQVGRDLCDICQRMRGLQGGDDTLLAAAQLKGVQCLAVGDRDVLDAVEIVQPGVSGPIPG